MTNRNDYEQVEKAMGLATSAGLHMGTFLDAARVAFSRLDYDSAARYAARAADLAADARKHALEAVRLTT